MSERWGWSERWDQPAILPHTCITCDVVEETLVVRIWDPADPAREVARLALDPTAARKVGTQLILGATAAEWEYQHRALVALVRESSARLAASVAAAPDDEVEPEPADPMRLAACPACGERAMSLEEQPEPGAVRWLARCGARWVTRDERVERELDPCPRTRARP